MKSNSKKALIFAGAVVLLVLILLFCHLRKDSVSDLVDPELLETVRGEVAEQFLPEETTETLPSDMDAERLRKGLCAILDAHGTEYRTDDSSNIIIRHEASEKYKELQHTVYCVNLESGSLEQDLPAVAAALYLAVRQQESPAYSVLFLNNEENLMTGAKNVSPSLFPKETRIICLSGGKFGLSTDSFASMNTRFSIPYHKSSRECDTGIRIRIDGIRTGIPGPSISDQPNPITQLSGIMTRLKTKSIRYQIAEIAMENTGNLYPSHLEVTLLVNSYSLDKVTKYLDKRAEDFIGKYSSDHPEISYSYEIIEDTESLPDEVYADSTADALMNLLYTVKNGTYRFKEGEAPEGYNEKGVYAINCLEELGVSKNNLQCRLYSEALNSTYLDQIIADNSAAAELSEATASAYNIAPEFKNGGSMLAEQFTLLYPQVNELSAKGSVVPQRYDTGATCCSYLDSRGKDMDTIHLTIREDCQHPVINTLLHLQTTQY